MACICARSGKRDLLVLAAGEQPALSGMTSSSCGDRPGAPSAHRVSRGSRAHRYDIGNSTMISSQSPSSGTRGYQHGPLKIIQQFDLGLARDILLSRFQWAKLPRVSSFDGLMVGRCLAELSVPRNLAMQGNGTDRTGPSEAPPRAGPPTKSSFPMPSRPLGKLQGAPGNHQAGG